MVNDSTELARKELATTINHKTADRTDLVRRYGQVWNTTQLQEDYKVLGFLAPMIIVIRKSDNKKGTLIFQHDPRFYFSFEEEA